MDNVNVYFTALLIYKNFGHYTVRYTGRIVSNLVQFILDSKINWTTMLVFYYVENIYWTTYPPTLGSVPKIS